MIRDLECLICRKNLAWVHIEDKGWVCSEKCLNAYRDADIAGYHLHWEYKEKHGITN